MLNRIFKPKPPQPMRNSLLLDPLAEEGKGGPELHIFKGYYLKSPAFAFVVRF